MVWLCNTYASLDIGFPPPPHPQLGKSIEVEVLKPSLSINTNIISLNMFYVLLISN